MSKFEASYVVETMDETSTHCACCGEKTRSIWGLLNREEATVAAYWVRWTEAHLAENGADYKFAIGPWGDGTTAEDRVAVKLLYRLRDDGEWVVIVADACDERLVGTSPPAACAATK